MEEGEGECVGGRVGLGFQLVSKKSKQNGWMTTELGFGWCVVVKLIIGTA
jgi:hypothetical protein